MKKTKKIFTKLAITFGVAFVACMATIPTQMSKYYEEKQEAEYLNAKKYASYDDEEYEITLSANELNNYTFNNFATLIFDILSLTSDIPTLTYNAQTYSFDSTYYYVYDSDYKIEVPNETHNNKFRYIDDYEGAVPPFEYALTLNSTDEYYAEIKQAIELDIQANQPHSMAGDIIASITAGLGMIGVLAGEFLTGFSTLFWTGSELTTFALFSLVFLGISITFAIISLVLNVLRNNTGV